MKKINIIKYKKEEGFTLVETLIAVLILIVSVVTPLSIASQAMVYSAIARDQIIASNIAQESIDFIRNERDRSALTTIGVSPARFNDFLNKFGVYTAGSETYCFGTAGCAIDAEYPTYRGAAAGVNEIVKEADFSYGQNTHVIDITTCTSTSSCPFLYLNDLDPVEANRTYTYGYVASSNINWRETPFKRKVKMTVIGSTSNPSEVLITVTVTWRTGSYDKQLIMNEYLKSWPDGII